MDGVSLFVAYAPLGALKANDDDDDDIYIYLPESKIPPPAKYVHTISQNR